MASAADCVFESTCAACTTLKDAFNVLICEWCVGNSTCLAVADIGTCVDTNLVLDYTKCDTLTKSELMTIVYIIGVLFGLILLAFIIYKCCQWREKVQRAKEEKVIMAQRAKEEKLEQDIETDGFDRSKHEGRKKRAKKGVRASVIGAPVAMKPGMRRSIMVAQPRKVELEAVVLEEK